MKHTPEAGEQPFRNLLNMEPDSVLNLEAPGDTVHCQLDAHPTPSKFLWWFVALDELAHLWKARDFPLNASKPIRLLNKPAGFQLETKSSALNLAASESSSLLFPTLTSTKEASKDDDKQVDSVNASEINNGKQTSRSAPTKTKQGLLLCKALNEFGWQRQPCLSLLLAPGK